MTDAPTWMKLEGMVLSEISQTHKDKYFMALLVRSTENSQIPKDRK